MVKTPKVSPLSNTIMRESHPGGVPQLRATRYAGCWGTFPECDYSLIPIRGYSLRSNLPSGDAFSVVQRVKFLKLPSGDAPSVVTHIAPPPFALSIPQILMHQNHLELARHRFAP